MMHASSDSDTPSMAPSSPSVPTPPAYYVQSPDSHDPSRDSQDETDKFPDPSRDDTDKFSSPISRSPSRSPCSNRRSSGASSESTAGSRVLGNRQRWNKPYCDVVREEEGGGYGGDVGSCCRVRQCSILVVMFGIVFGGTCLAILVAGRQYESQVSIKSLRVANLFVGQGSDYTGVPTKLISVNCSATLAIYNPATFFGIHVVSRTANLIYSQITVATGQMKKCYIPRKSKLILWVILIGHEVPLYGAKMALGAYNSNDEVRGGIPFKLEIDIESRGFLMGKLVKTKHTIHASCLLLINPKHAKEISLGPRSCEYIS
ncbi:hypothetical protein CASFOL_026869 [Castilleja foliolosa]|uniref:Late embryogenesis abundant protein LEA-2 subgroup domain-containing protein n=1 Tax=Castilleja foliolosa TaxID=1961234 RepID=A0ABD3CJJ5_9LAMI